MKIAARNPFPIRTVGLFLVATLVTTLATDAEPLRLSMRDAVRMAIANAPTAKIAKVGEERARAAAAMARAALLPETEARLLRYNQSINLQTFGFAQPGQPPVVGPFNVTDAQISAAMNLFDLASIRRYEAARQGISISRMQVEQAEEDIAAAAARLYLLIERGGAEIAAHEANVTLFTDLRRLASDQFTAGTGTRLDVARADVQVSREQQTLLVARNQRDAARLALLHVIGADQSSEVIQTDPPRADTIILPSLTEALPTALRERMDIRVAAARERQAELGVSAARAARIPTVGLDLVGDMSGNNADDLHWSRRVGGGVNIPIFAGGRIAAQLADAKALEHEARIQQEESLRTAEEEVRRSILNVESSVARIAVAAEVVRVAQEELDSARNRYEHGAGSSIEVDRAEDAWRQAREDQIAAQSDAAMAAVDLRHATGTMRSWAEGTAPAP
jgi:outer membrane protein